MIEKLTVIKLRWARSNLRIRGLLGHLLLDRVLLLLDRILLLDGVSRGDDTSILRGKWCLASLGVRRIRSTGVEVYFSDIAIPDTSVATHMLPDDHGEDSDVVEEQEKPGQETEGGYCFNLVAHGFSLSGAKGAVKPGKSSRVSSDSEPHNPKEPCPANLNGNHGGDGPLALQGEEKHGR